MIPNRFAHIKEKQRLEELKPQIEDTSIVFCPESKEIITHGENYGKPEWGTLGYPLNRTIFYTTNDGNTISVKEYWPQPILNEYDKEKDRGIMVFENELTEIPGISGNPFLHDQKNLLTLKLPTTIKRLNHGCFFGCSNLYQCNVEDLVLEELGYGCFEKTAIKKLDYRKSVFTHVCNQALRMGQEANIDFVLFPPTVTSVDFRFISESYISDSGLRIKTLMIPTLDRTSPFIENNITENLIINKFDGVADLHYFKGDVKIWVPDQWYDVYIDYYTNNFVYENWQDIISRLRKYSEGVPVFPYQ